MRVVLILCTVCVLLTVAQRNNNRRQGGRRNNNNNKTFGRNGVTRNGVRDAKGTEVYPGCNGKVCLPEANLCALRKEKPGHKLLGGKSYFLSWDSSEEVIKQARWNWFTARNFCRKMCMDLVSTESSRELGDVGKEMKRGGVKEVWTSGRLCDKEVDGCDTPRFRPYNIRGWFWASTLQSMGETNVTNNPRKFNAWSDSGPGGRIQPDGILKADGFGEQACTAILDNVYNDGLTWHDTKCNDRRQIVCEDLPAGNINFVRKQNPNVNIP